MIEGTPRRDEINRPGGALAALLLGLLVGCAFSLAMWSLSRTLGGLFVAAPLILLGGGLRQARPGLAAFLLGFSLGALVYPAWLLVRFLARL